MRAYATAGWENFFVAEVGAAAALTGLWALPIRIQLGARVPGTPRRWMVTRVVAHQIATLPLVVAGVSLLARAGGGLYWLLGGRSSRSRRRILNAWVLLVEIQR